MKKLILTVLFLVATVQTASAVSKVNLNIGGGLVTSTGRYGGSFLGGVMFQVDPSSSLQLGLESGLYFGSGTGLPIFFSVLFPVADQNKSIRPFIQGSVGPLIGLSGGGVFGSGTIALDDVKMAFLFRPGFFLKLMNNLELKVEMPIGGFTGLFVVGPMVGACIHL